MYEALAGLGIPLGLHGAASKHMADLMANGTLPTTPSVEYY